MKKNADSGSFPLDLAEETRDREAGPRLFELDAKSISKFEFSQFQELIYRTAGIWLSEQKTALLVGWLSKRLRSLGLKSFAQYFRVVSDDPEELTRMLDLISTNETRFFREPSQFEFLEQRVLPHWVSEAESGSRPRTVRVWSAGCSTGQEPFSLAMCLRYHLPPSSGWTVDITATDISTRVLEVAESANWDFSKAAEIPEHYRKAFMLSEREFNLLKTTDPGTRFFLVKQNKDVVVARIDLSGMDDVIMILSGRADTVVILQQVLKESGNDPEIWMPMFQERVGKSKD